MSEKIAFRNALTPGMTMAGRNVGVVIPSEWETAAMTVQVSNDGVTYSELYNDAGSAVSIAATANTAMSLDTKAVNLYPFGYFKLRSGTSVTPVLQGVTAANRVYTFGAGKTLTITSGVKGSVGNELTFGFATAKEDTLSVTVDGTEVTVNLACDTAAKNSAALIEAEIQAATISDIDVTGLTVAESAGYAAARPAATKAVALISFMDAEETAQGALTLTAGIAGAGGNFVSDTTWGVNEADALDVSVNDLGQVEILLASTTGTHNTAAAIQTAIQALTGTDFDEFLAAMTVTSDATWTGAPVTGATYVTCGLTTDGSTTGADIVVPAAAPLLGGQSLEIEVSFRD